ncbi:MAG: DMT family transporter [Flavobacteriales bacterium]|nr:DMT family transporter [Flavobacteriales bacterium]MDW8410551.1 DMT family transporter [Flavobacteriales bacterium]
MSFLFQNPAFRFAVLVFLGALWGASFLFIKWSLRSFRAYEVALLRIALSAIVLVPLVWSGLRKLAARDYLPLMAAGLFGNGFPAFFWAGAQQGLDSAFGGLLNSSTPLFTLIISMVFFKTKPTRLTLLGLGVALAGISLFFFLAQKQAGSSHFSLPHAGLALCGAACYGVSLNLVRHRLLHVQSHVVGGGPFLLMGAIAFIMIPMLPDFPTMFFRPGSSKAFLFLCLLAVFATGLGVWLFNMVIKQTTALAASSVTYLIPIFSLLWGSLAGEPFHPFSLIVLVIILLGIYLIQKSETIK